MNASWPLFRALRTDVRVHWSILLVPLAFFAGFAEWFDAWEALAWALAWTTSLYVVVWTHEMGHAAVGRRFGTPFPLITLSPLGGLAHSAAPMASPRADLWTSLAGPATHVAWLALVLPPYFLLDVRTRPEDWAWMANGFVQMNVALLVFNLLPFYPLDGGRALRAMLASRMHVSKASWFCAWVGYAGALLIGLAGIWSTIQGDALLGRLWGPVMIALAVTSFLACRQLQAEARHAIEGPYEPVEPWAGSLPGDSWREPVQDPVDREEERRRRQAAEEERREREFRRRLRERIDELLDRINEVGGVENLSPDERRELAEASELLRRETAER